MNSETWIVEEEILSDGSNVFNVVSYQLDHTIILPCENWAKATALAELLNAEAPTVEIASHHWN